MSEINLEKAVGHQEADFPVSPRGSGARQLTAHAAHVLTNAGCMVEARSAPLRCRHWGESDRPNSRERYVSCFLPPIRIRLRLLSPELGGFCCKSDTQLLSNECAQTRTGRHSPHTPSSFSSRAKTRTSTTSRNASEARLRLACPGSILTVAYAFACSISRDDHC